MEAPRCFMGKFYFHRIEQTCLASPLDMPEIVSSCFSCLSLSSAAWARSIFDFLFFVDKIAVALFDALQFAVEGFILLI